MNTKIRYSTLLVSAIALSVILACRLLIPETPTPFLPALQSLAGDPTPSEQNVLLIALGLALYYDSLRNRRYIYDW